MTKSEGDIDKKREIIDLDADEPLTEKRVNDGSPNGWSKKWWNNETKSSNGVYDDLPALIKEKTWVDKLSVEFSKPYFKSLVQYLNDEAKNGKTIFPPKDDIFSCFNACPFDKIRIVIIGQDPYHNIGQAHGQCFSVRRGVDVPPSLKNIYKELHSDIGFSIPSHGHLQQWSERGVLLLNNVLTVRAHEAASHKGQGWETFTDAVISMINEQRSNVVFLLWGDPAQKKGAKISESKHCVIKSPHPSPLSAFRGFLGSKFASRANTYLVDKGLEPMDWSLSDK